MGGGAGGIPRRGAEPLRLAGQRIPALARARARRADRALPCKARSRRRGLRGVFRFWTASRRPTSSTPCPRPKWRRSSALGDLVFARFRRAPRQGLPVSPRNADTAGRIAVGGPIELAWRCRTSKNAKRATNRRGVTSTQSSVTRGARRAARSGASRGRLADARVTVLAGPGGSTYPGASPDYARVRRKKYATFIRSCRQGAHDTSRPRFLRVPHLRTGRFGAARNAPGHRRRLRNRPLERPGLPGAVGRGLPRRGRDGRAVAARSPRGKAPFALTRVSAARRAGARAFGPPSGSWSRRRRGRHHRWRCRCRHCPARAPNSQAWRPARRRRGRSSR